MKTHFAVGGDLIACGKNNHNINATKNVTSVDCAACKSTDIFKHAEQTFRQLTENPVKVKGDLPKTAWRKYLSDLPSKSKLPRGF